MATNTQEIHFQQQELKGKDFLTLADYTKDEIEYLIDLADYLKKQQKDRVIFEPLKGKTLGMIFEKSSTRTRVSFETGIYQLGGLGIFLSSKDIQIGRGESIADTAKVLSGYLDGIMIRTFAQEDVEELAKHASIPVINGLTDLYHPCQALADLQTIKEVKGKLQGEKLVYIGDGNNMTHSLMIGASLTGMHMVAVTPDGYTPNKEVLTKAKSIADQHGAIIEWTTDVETAVQGADVLYTDVWASMGQEEEQQQREKDFENYQVNERLLEKAKTDAIFMHCLPAHRGEEVTTGVIDGKQSVVFQQAENRLHAQKALMTALMTD
ncbi:ornithine carbamoyltransferase [Oceanobacillus kimchii]|uniref:ornithine carbamoyltransferase n=1 Tax=Oceanobacillus kimchii TaxID=746691 RepID=UPI0021A94684|nr:ornithine carbamoyltransferase [Oceanobacillus kimchii]MCT1577496.1 ornithine carbamoyltransferase [Oceanobacillus kimchii]MCT2137104.1 ornithine carbamoyltransferase [Oceanobacillus kimchii]